MSSAVWFDTEHEIAIPWEDTIDPNEPDPLQRGAAWCYPGGMAATIGYTPTRDRFDLDRWIVTVPRRSRDAAAALARRVFVREFAGDVASDALLSRFIAELHREIWRHVEGGPYR